MLARWEKTTKKSDSPSWNSENWRKVTVALNATRLRQQQQKKSQFFFKLGGEKKTHFNRKHLKSVSLYKKSDTFWVLPTRVVRKLDASYWWRHMLRSETTGNSEITEFRRSRQNGNSRFYLFIIIIIYLFFSDRGENRFKLSSVSKSGIDWRHDWTWYVSEFPSFFPQKALWALGIYREGIARCVTITQKVKAALHWKLKLEME